MKYCKTINSSDLSAIAKITKTFSKPHQYYVINDTDWHFKIRKGFSSIRKIK